MTTTSTECEVDPQIEIEFGLWWPAADPEGLRDVAAAWDAMAVALEAAIDGLGSERYRVRSANEGEAVEAFARCLDGWTDGHLPGAAERCRQLAAASRAFADAVDEAQDTIRRLAVEVAASIAIGVGLAFFTAGVSTGAAAVFTAAAVARAGLVATSLAARAIAVLSRVVAFAGVGALESGATNLVIQTGRNAVTTPNHDPFATFDPEELQVSTLGGAVLGGTLGTLRSIPLIRGIEPVGPGRIILPPLPGVAPPASAGLSGGAASSAFEGMRGGGGHAMRHLIEEGLLPDAGSLASRTERFAELAAPVLRSPERVFAWRLGASATRAFAGRVGGRRVVFFVAEDGPFRGRVISAVVPSPDQVLKWRLP